MKNLKGMKIMINLYLSPSTQEKNVGQNDYGTEEKQMNVLADKIQNVLNNYKEFKIYRNNPNWKLHEVITDSNYYAIDLHLALHSNANNRIARGCEVFCHKFDTQAHEYAKIFYDNLEKITPTVDRGVKEGFNFYGPNNHMAELYKTKANAVLIEIDFHDNIDSAKWILDNLDLIAKNIIDSILQIFGIDKIVENQIEFTDIDTHYAKEVINEAKKIGLVKGYPDMTFKPDEPMTRAECTILALNLYKKIREG